MTIIVCLLTTILAWVLAWPAQARQVDTHPSPGFCRAADVAVRIEHGDGRFTGMSHDGAIVVVRNIGARNCLFSALPELVMLDTRSAVVARGEPPQARAMHPGPYVPPLELVPGAMAASTLRWLAGNVFGDEPARSARASAIGLSLDGTRATTPISATIWTRANQPAVFGMERFTTALPPLGPTRSPSPGRFVGEGPAGATYIGAAGMPAQTMVIRARSAGLLDFRFDGIAGSAPNLGSISGVLVVRGSRATFRDEPRDCALTITFYSTQLTVEQSGTCGFGNAVTAQGHYRSAST